MFCRMSLPRPLAFVLIFWGDNDAVDILVLSKRANRTKIKRLVIVLKISFFYQIYKEIANIFIIQKLQRVILKIKIITESTVLS